MTSLLPAAVCGFFVLALALSAKPIEGAVRRWRHARRRAWWRRRRHREDAAFERQRRKRGPLAD